MTVKTNDKKRVHSRRSVLWSAELCFGDHRFDCQIWNLSFGGARLQAGLPLLAGTEVYLVLKKVGKLKATVAWENNNVLGVSFDDSEDVIKSKFKDQAEILGFIQNA